MKEVKYYDPVLLYEGFGLEQALPGANIDKTYQLTNQRGFVKKLDVNVPSAILDTATIDARQRVSIWGNGQTLVDAQPVVDFLSYKQNNNVFTENIPSALNENGSVRFLLDNSDAFSIPAAIRAELVAHYSTQDHENFLKRLKPSHSLSLKRKTFEIDKPELLAGEQFDITGEIESGYGDAVGFSISSAIQNENIVFTDAFSVQENGIEIVKNYSAINTLAVNGRKDWVHGS